VRDYFSTILPGLADLPTRCLPDLTPAMWVGRTTTSGADRIDPYGGRLNLIHTNPFVYLNSQHRDRAKGFNYLMQKENEQ